MEEIDRQILIDRATAGDAEALQRVLIEYHDALRGSVERRIERRLTPHFDPEDVLQDTYAAAYRSVRGCTFATPGAFYRWLETIAANRLTERQRMLRSAKRDVDREVRSWSGRTASFPGILDRIAGVDATPSRSARRDEAVAALLSSLARLSDEQRHVVRLRFLEGKPVAEIAVALGKTEGAVHALCRRGLRSLRESLVSMSRFLTRT